MTSEDRSVGRKPAPRSELEALKEEIEALERFDLDLLRRRWRKLLGRPAPARLSRGLLLRILAYRHQLARLGDIDRASRRELDETVGGPKPGGGSGLACRASAAAALRPGTVLEREYAGAVHRVMVTAAGCCWNGREFRSLSEAARAITGTRWNGPRFFGLRAGEKAETSADGGSDADPAAAELR